MVSSVQLFFVLTILVTVISTGLAINCFVCDSSKYPNCADKLQANDSFKFNCSKKLFGGNAKGCLKVVYSNATTTWVKRNCYNSLLNSKDADCKFASKMFSAKMESCDICEKDMCNGSSSIVPIAFSVFLLLGVARVLA